MAKHNIYFDIPKQELSKVDANFYIVKDGEKLGQITFSKGGVDYYPRHRKKNPIKISWSRFDELMRGEE
jgi:hypothetical protein